MADCGRRTRADAPRCAVAVAPAALGGVGPAELTALVAKRPDATLAEYTKVQRSGWGNGSASNKSSLYIGGRSRRCGARWPVTTIRPARCRSCLPRPHDTACPDAD